MNYKTFRDLRCWQEAHKLVLAIYRVTQDFPNEEKFGLSIQIRRSAASICANMAEGFKKSRKDFVRYLDISQASLEETKYHFILSNDLGYLTSDQYQSLNSSADDVGKMLYGLIASLKS